MSQFSDYVASVDGVGLDVDGNYGAQCWDLWSHYAVNLFGASAYATSTNSGGSTHQYGYACEIWHNAWTSPICNWFTPVDGPPQRGDVAIWEWGSPIAPLSHVAIVLEDAGPNLYCLTQNPGSVHKAHLSKGGVLGYLRPDNQSVFDGEPAPAPAPAPSAGGQQYTIVPGDTLWAVAARFYGDGTRYMEIFNASNFRSGNPNLIFPGEIAIIP